MKTFAQPPTTLEIRRQIAALNERRAAITVELQAIFAETVKRGVASSSPILLDDDEKAARQHALSLLSGVATDISLPPEVSRERELFRERRGIDLALAVLARKLEDATAAAVAKWWKAQEAKWQALAREMVLAAIRLNALDRRAEAMFTGIETVHLPPVALGRFIGIVAQTPIHELVAAAMESGVLTRAEIQEVELAK
jgi:hypothetical protein